MVQINIDNSLCFTGHRPNRLYGYDPKIKGNLELIKNLKDIIEFYINNHGVDTFITGMALGVDTWAARIILKLKESNPTLKLVAAIPCKNQYKKWNQSSIEEYKYILSKCDMIHYVSENDYTNYCMVNRDKWMVDNSSYIIAVWNGSNSGTGTTVKYAVKNLKPVHVLNPINYEQYFKIN